MRERCGRRIRQMVAIALVGGGLAGCGNSDAIDTGQVVRVIDGDTIVVAGIGTVRYIGIDTPELHHPNRPVQRLADAAWRRNRSLVGAKRVRVVREREPVDAHGRVLGDVYVDGVFVNAVLVREGLARTLAIRPNTVHAALLAQEQRAAMRGGRGLWGTAEGGVPWGVP